MNEADVPVIVFAYKRPRHLERTLAALARCAGAAETDLIVFCDGARTPRDMALVQMARAVARRADGFRSVAVHAAQVNRGLGRAVIEGVSEVLRAYEAAIVIEDDVEAAPGLLVFMREALARYRDDRRVFSIAGYVPPVAGREPHGDGFFVPRICSWGWATWRDRWEEVDWAASGYRTFMRERSRRARFSRAGRDMLDMLVNQIEGEAESWAIRFDFARFLAGDALTLYPTQTLVTNIGMDGSGEHREASSQYASVPGRKTDFALPARVEEAHELTRAFARFYPRRLRSRLAIWARRLHVHGPARRLYRFVFD